MEHFQNFSHQLRAGVVAQKSDQRTAFKAVLPECSPLIAKSLRNKHSLVNIEYQA